MYSIRYQYYYFFFIQFQFCNSSMPNMYNNWFLSCKITMGTMHMVISAAIASCAKYIAGYCKYPQRQKSQITFSIFTITYKIIKALIILFSGQRILKTYPLIADIGVELLQKAAWNHVVWELNNPPQSGL